MQAIARIRATPGRAGAIGGACGIGGSGSARSTAAPSGTASTVPWDGASDRPDRRDEAIAPARQRLDEPRVLGRVAEHLAQLLDRRVEGVIEIDEGVGGPEPLAHRLAGDHLARALEEHHQQLKRLLLQLQPDALAPKLPRLEIDFEGPEPDT